jgi:DNA (cytosine-5)-methyltransferase 1
MRVLDLFCGAGGASAGYARAGYSVVGVDIRPQPHYDEWARFIQADVMDSIDDIIADVNPDLIHASPPCQVWTRARHLRTAQGASTKSVDLLTPILSILKAYGLPYIVENVPGAPLRADVTLCGSMFDCTCHGQCLGVRRHRLFQTNLPLRAPGPCRHKEQGRPVGVYHVMGDDIPKGGRTARTLTEASHAMGIGWMTWDELKEAIPPAYTRWLGSLAAEVLDGRE